MAGSRASIVWLLVCALMALAAAEPKRSAGIFANKANNDTQKAQKSGAREGKVFSLFNVVNFANAGCATNSAVSGSTTGSVRMGTCYTASECQTLGGQSAGSCAAGFGVCCLFTASASGSVISQNCTYIRNTGFPTALKTTDAIKYTVNKVDNSVCFLRLDFMTFTIQGTTDTFETTGGTCADTFVVTTTPKSNIPTICGQNTGQHMYVDLSQDATGSATLDFTFLATAPNPMRQWEIKTTQVPCGSAAAPPGGCLQYVTGISGTFTTFNYLTTTGTHLANQQYSYCIRQEEGYCCVQYTPCSDALAFSLSQGKTTVTMAQQDALCTLDYIGIAGSSGVCNQNAMGAQLTNKYCGAFLNQNSVAVASTPICDCTRPFAIEVHTDNLPDNGAGGSNTAVSRGECLNWMQLTCH